jgi:UPF0755 protein
MRMGRVVAVLVLAAAAALGGAFFYVERMASTPAGTSDEPVVFDVPKGAALNQIGKKLAKEGLIGSELVFKVHVKLHPPPSAKAGKHELRKSMALSEILAKLGENPIPDDVPLTMVEGWRLRDADAFLAAKGLIEAGEYEKAASDKSKFTVPFEVEGPSLAGYLLPETYMVPPGRLDVNALIQRQIDAFAGRFAKPQAEEIARSGRTLSAVVIMASMLEREEPKSENRPAVAGVLYKRLDSKTPLGVDATSRFTLADWNDRRSFLEKLRDPDDPYNTRVRAGLPPTPIGAPSLDSLLAALRPKSGPYWYYLHDDGQNIHFARTADEHEANRRRYNVY